MPQPIALPDPRRARDRVPLLRRPARVALVDDCEIVTVGLRHLLAPYSDLELVGGQWAVDVVLYDPALPDAGDDRDQRLGDLVDGAGHVAVFTWDASRFAIERALSAGARAWLSKSLDGDALASGLRGILAGRIVVDRGGPGPQDPAEDAADAAGLSRREREVLALIGCGVTNEDIARTLFLSPNSIKSYIRSAYRKIGVERRAQAVLWANQHGLVAGDIEAPGPAA